MDDTMMKIRTIVYYANDHINALSNTIIKAKLTQNEKDEVELHVKLTRDKLNILDRLVEKINPSTETEAAIPRKDKCPVCGKEVILTYDEMECLATVNMCHQCLKERIERKRNENKNI